MCGLAGIVTDRELAPEALERSAAAMLHRGPDAGATLQRGAAAFAYRRLRIIDLRPEGDQPMCNETGEVWLVFNGEIYNFQQLRRLLEQRHRFRSRTDSETLLHGYEEWGFEGLLRRIDGMFAFAIWDERSQELWLARDRVGKKPLFYSQVSPRELVFASTLNALLELLPVPPEVDRVALDQYLVYQAVPAPQTIFTGVGALPPAHYLRFRQGQPASRPQRYWHLSYARKQRRSEPDLLAEADSLLRDAVSRRLVADVPLGAFLSGGVDSSIVVAIMAQLRSEPVETVTVGFDDPRFDERPFARQVAQRWRANAHEYVLPPDDIQELPLIIWHYGQPMADVSILPTFAVARCAREHVTVVLNGDGGDEAFCGYSRPVVARAAQICRGWIPAGARDPARRLIGLLGKRGQLLATALATEARDSFVYERGFRGCRARLYHPDALLGIAGLDPDEHYRQAWTWADGPTDADRVLSAELTTYLPDQLLSKMDVSTMAHSIEARSPLLDTRLLEFAATIPIEQLTKGWQTKYLLKRLAARYVPQEVLYRQKQGFVTPVSRWIREELAPLTRELLKSLTCPERGLFRRDWVMGMLDDHLGGREDWGQQLWTLIVLEIWYRMFVDRTLDPHTRLDRVAPGAV
ncbi:MAG TPA: asparagine synthase (glutamine-hydrolyzing) [Steroidobacteraceae bacterium]|nr:asparagine synthase (glutamine-hydrolyzing) [Steroidobacteraceae bacterium]